MNRLVFWLAITVGTLVLAMIGNWHFVYGSKVATQAIEKVSWSLGESVINIDEVGNLPMIFARSKYPFFLAALERDSEVLRMRKEATEKAPYAPSINQQAVGTIGEIRLETQRSFVIQTLGEPDSRIGPFPNSTGDQVETLFYSGVGSINLTNGVVKAVNKY